MRSRASQISTAAIGWVALSTAATADFQGPTTISVEGIVLQRDDIGSARFTGPDEVGEPFVSFTANNIDPDWSGGLRVSLGGMKFWGQHVQFSAFAAWPFEAEGTVFDLNQDGTNATYDDDDQLNPGADVNTSNSDDLFALKVEHETWLAGTDTAVLHGSGFNGISFIYGTRFLYLSERLKSTAFDSENDFLGEVGEDDDIDRVRIKSENTLYGPQIGFVWNRPIHSGITFDGSLKGGLLLNLIDVERNFSSDDTDDRIDNKIDDTAFAQFVEFRPQLSFDLAPGVSLTAGGMLLYINGISESTEYFSTVTDDDDRKVRDDGDAFFYGGSLGLKFALN